MSQTALENVGLNELSFTDVAENFVSETPLNFNPYGMHDLNMKDIKVDGKDSIFILLLNIFLLHKHFDELYELCVSLRYKPDILCITETRLADVPLINISIPRYNFFHCNSPTIVGGVGAYFKQNIKVESTNKFIFNMNGVKEIWFEFAGTNSLEKQTHFWLHLSTSISKKLTRISNKFE